MELMWLYKTDTSRNLYMIEEYESLIWTERYLEPGDFELVSKNPGYYWNKLQLGDLVSIRESGEVAMVESRNIKEDAQGVKTVTIKGRTVDAFLDERVIPGRGGKKYKMNKQYRPDQAASVLIWQAVCNPTNTDVVLATTVTSQYSADQIPNARVSNKTRSVFPVGNRYVSPGQVLPEVHRFLRSQNLGLKTLRGGWGSQINNVAVSTTAATRGAITLTVMNGTDDLVFEIYEGYDRSHGNADGNDPVVFSVPAGHFDEPETLDSLEGFKTWAHVDSENGDVGSTRNSTEFNLGGWDRRVVYVDAGGPAEGEVVQDFIDNLDEVGKDELKKRQKKDLFDGKIAVISPYILDLDYFLGDIVSIGDQDSEDIRPMRVAEYVRTDDENGSRGYPALAQLDES